MLNKIGNIENSSKFTHTHRKNLSIYEKYSKSNAFAEDLGQDSITFSPAATFISQVNWQIGEVDYSSSNNVLLDFFIENVHFKMNIDIVDFYRNSYQKVFLSSERTSLTKRRLFNVILLVKKPDIRLFERYSSFPIKGIQSLFNKLEKLNFTSDLLRFEEVVYSTILDGVEENVLVDFTNIFYVIYSFLHKLKKYDIQNHFEFPVGRNNLIKIEKVTADER